MAKKEKIEKEVELSDEISKFLAKEAGVEVISLSEMDQVESWTDTENLALNWIIANDFKKGIPNSKSVLIYGPSQAGKSLVTDILLGSNIKAGGVSFCCDVEDAKGSDFTSEVINDVKIAAKIKMIVPDKSKKEISITIEKLRSILLKLIEFNSSKAEDKKIPNVLIVIDSISQLSSEKEIEDTKKDKNTRDMTAQQEMRKIFRVVNQMQRSGKLTIVGIAHETALIGGMAFGPKTTPSAKGSGFTYANSLALRIVNSKEITDAKTGAPIGTRIKIKTTKNRIKFRGRDCWVSFYMGRGIDRYSGLPELMVQYGIAKASAKMDVNKILPPTSKITYSDLAGNEYEFKAGDFSKFVEKLENKDEFLEDINQSLNNVFENLTKDVDQSELLEDDSIQDFEDLPEEE